MEPASFDLSAAVLAKLEKGDIIHTPEEAPHKETADDSGLTEIYTKYRALLSFLFTCF